MFHSSYRKTLWIPQNYRHKALAKVHIYVHELDYNFLISLHVLQSHSPIGAIEKAIKKKQY